MRIKRPRQYEDEPETVSLDIGSYNSFTAVPKDDHKKKKDQIGFIRNKPNRRSKVAIKSINVIGKIGN